MFQVKFSRFSKGKCCTTEATGMISAVFILSFYFQQFEANIWNCGVSVRKYCIFGKSTNISLSRVLRLERKETEESKTGEDLHGLLLSKL